MPEFTVSVSLTRLSHKREDMGACHRMQCPVTAPPPNLLPALINICMLQYYTDPD